MQLGRVSRQLLGGGPPSPSSPSPAAAKRNERPVCLGRPLVVPWSSALRERRMFQWGKRRRSAKVAQRGRCFGRPCSLWPARVVAAALPPQAALPPTHRWQRAVTVAIFLLGGPALSERQVPVGRPAARARSARAAAQALLAKEALAKQALAERWLGAVAEGGLARAGMTGPVQGPPAQAGLAVRAGPPASREEKETPPFRAVARPVRGESIATSAGASAAAPWRRRQAAWRAPRPATRTTSRCVVATVTSTGTPARRMLLGRTSRTRGVACRRPGGLPADLASASRPLNFARECSAPGYPFPIATNAGCSRPPAARTRLAVAW